MAAQQVRASTAIAYLRSERARCSARALSLNAGLSDAYVGKIESGAIEPSLRGFAKLAVALGMSATEIFMVIRAEAELDMPRAAAC